jgi:hypothetical protein
MALVAGRRATGRASERRRSSVVAATALTFPCSRMS